MRKQNSSCSKTRDRMPVPSMPPKMAAVHPHLKELRLWGTPGNLGNFSAVQEFRELTNLSTFDLFGFGAADIPTPEQMPELRWFWMTSLPETAAKAAKQLWKGKPGMALRGILDALPGDTLQKDALIEKFEELRDF